MRFYLFCFFIAFLGGEAMSQTPLFIPDTLSGSSINLSFHSGQRNYFAGNLTNTFGYNQYATLGPTLVLNQGQNVQMHVENLISDTTTVHWHGLHVPSSCDGGPHTPIFPGNTWSPQFTVLDPASTYWYHPHFHGKTAQQVTKGAAGLILVRDSLEAALPLPRVYGVDDIPIILQCQQYNSMNQVMPLGMQDSTLLVNGDRANYGHEVVATLPAQVVRLRLLNAAGERAFLIGFSGNKTFYQIGTDGGLLENSLERTRVRLAPGERAEILVDLSGWSGQTLHLMSYASELPMGVQGGPTMPMPPPAPPMDSPLNGVDFNLMTIQIGPETANAIHAIPTQLVTYAMPSEAAVQQNREIRFSADNAMIMDGPFYFNGKLFDMDRIDFYIPLDNIERWKLVNETMVAHPFHLHDVPFYITKRNEQIPSSEDVGRKDVVFLLTGDSVEFITQFTDFTDEMIPYMFHCHILMHEDDGMMGQFLVVPPEFLANQQLQKLDKWIVYPNPVKSELNFAGLEVYSIEIYNAIGERIEKQLLLGSKSLQIDHLSSGSYRIKINFADGKSGLLQFIKQN